MKLNINIKNIEKIKYLLVFAVVGLFSLTSVSCSDDDEDKIEGDPYTKLGIRINGVDQPLEDDYALTMAAGGGSVEGGYTLHTNLPHWTVETEKPEDAEWIDIWPNEGKLDGRFYVKLEKNRTQEERVSKIHIRSNGVTYRTFDVTQATGKDELWLSMTSITMDAAASEFLIDVYSNFETKWTAQSNVEWLIVSKMTEDNKLGIIMLENTETDPKVKPRVGVITVTSIEKPSVTAKFTVTQNNATI